MNIAGLLISFLILLICVTIHEFSHGWVAYKLGDNTAKYSGRLTLNPLAHIDPLMTIILPLFLFFATQGRFVFGAAKPVPVDFRQLRNPKKDIIWVGLSGPLANFIAAILASLLWRIIPGSDILNFIFTVFVSTNLVLGFFNLVPIPPLDGSRVVMGLLPQRLSYKYAALEPYGFIVIMALIYMGLFRTIVEPIVETILRLLIP